jgi:hypothetical protein
VTPRTFPSETTGERTFDGENGPVEGREERVAGRVDFTAAEACDLGSDGGVVLFHEFSPAAIAERRSELGRADDVGEHHREQHARRGRVLDVLFPGRARVLESPRCPPRRVFRGDPFIRHAWSLWHRRQSGKEREPSPA